MIVWFPQSTYRGWLNLESLLRDNRSHAPIEVKNKCLDLSRIYIAANAIKTIARKNAALFKFEINVLSMQRGELLSIGLLIL